MPMVEGTIFPESWLLSVGLTRNIEYFIFVYKFIEQKQLILSTAKMAHPSGKPRHCNG